VGLLDRHAGLLEVYRANRTAGQVPVRITMDKMLSPTEAVIDGRRVVTVGTHNYLGLSFAPECVEAAVAAVRAEGTGTCGSRIANGSFSEHEALEREIADYYGMNECMVFSTGYQANLGIISTLVGEGDYLVIDADSHASIYDASKQTQATIIRFKHNDPASLEARLRRLAKEPGNKLVVVEGIYSMLGDTAPLREFVDICKRYGAYILVDEAHSMGALGEHARGLAEAMGVLDDIDIVVGTFSKALGAVGGYCVSNLPDFEALRLTCRPYMFTASLPPSTIASVRAALKLIVTRPQLRERLWDNVRILYSGLAAAGFRLGPEPSPVVAVRLRSPEATIHAWRALLNAGYYVNVGLPPATPNGESLLRCAVSAAHSRSQLEGLIDALSDVAHRLGLIEHSRLQIAAAE